MKIKVMFFMLLLSSLSPIYAAQAAAPQEPSEAEYRHLKELVKQLEGYVKEATKEINPYGIKAPPSENDVYNLKTLVPRVLGMVTPWLKLNPVDEPGNYHYNKPRCNYNDKMYSITPTVRNILAYLTKFESAYEAILFEKKYEQSNDEDQREIVNYAIKIHDFNERRSKASSILQDVSKFREAESVKGSRSLQELNINIFNVLESLKFDGDFLSKDEHEAFNKLIDLTTEDGRQKYAMDNRLHTPQGYDFSAWDVRKMFLKLLEKQEARYQEFTRMRETAYLELSANFSREALNSFYIAGDWLLLMARFNGLINIATEKQMLSIQNALRHLPCTQELTIAINQKWQILNHKPSILASVRGCRDFFEEHVNLIIEADTLSKLVAAVQQLPKIDTVPALKAIEEAFRLLWLDTNGINQKLYPLREPYYLSSAIRDIRGVLKSSSFKKGQLDGLWQSADKASFIENLWTLSKETSAVLELNALRKACREIQHYVPKDLVSFIDQKIAKSKK